jgi:serine O-acetyltransferase
MPRPGRADDSFPDPWSTRELAIRLRGDSGRRVPASRLPDEQELASATDLFRRACLPEIDRPTWSDERLGVDLHAAAERLVREATNAFALSAPADEARARAAMTVTAFLTALPALSGLVASDLEAACERDPAVRSPTEVALCYPGLLALSTHRLAHELFRLGVPLLPRMMSEAAHRATGIDIHPGASIGPGFFIDHGTGVVIGETTVIGARCTLYQGVTLGALSFPRDAEGKLIRGTKRHPTLEDDVIVYAGATILGGDTVIGRGSIVAGGVFVTRSVPPDHVVQGPRVELRIRSHKRDEL